MKRILLIGSLSLAAAVILPGSASAQDTVKRAGTVMRTPTYESLTTAISQTQAATEKVKTRMVTASDIRVVDAKTLVGSNEKTVKAALDTHKDHLTDLRAAISNNPSFTSALAAHKDKPTANDVIAVDIQDEGDVLVYFHKMK